MCGYCSRVVGKAFFSESQHLKFVTGLAFKSAILTSKYNLWDVF